MARRPDSKDSVSETVVISDLDLKRLSSTTLVERLVAHGMSPLSAERFLEIRRGTAEPGRARAHAVSRR